MWGVGIGFFKYVFFWEVVRFSVVLAWGGFYFAFVWRVWTSVLVGRRRRDRRGVVGGRGLGFFCCLLFVLTCFSYEYVGGEFFVG